MKKLFCIVIVVIILSIAAGCTAPDVSEGNTPPVPPAQEGHDLEDAKDPLEEKAEALLGKMTLNEKVGQLLIVGFPEDTKKEALQDYIDRLKVSGFILFSRNYTDFDSLYALVRSLKEMNSPKNPLPLFISVDEEGGTVSRLPKGGTHFPDARQVGKAGEPGLTYKAGQTIAQELKAAGINLNFAPVLDIVESSENKLLIRRSYGSTPEVVSLHGTSFINGLQSKGVIAVPKHFPGHGNTDKDSHSMLPVIDTDKAAMQSRELVPFKAAIDAGLDAVMVGHIAFPRIDPTGLPATMSNYFLTDVLRKDLGFEGISISDDIEMQGYISSKDTIEECVTSSFNAGLDIFLIGHTKAIQDQVFTALRDACGDGRISEERLNESVLRIIKVKLKIGLTDTMEYKIEEAKRVFGSDEHKSVLEELNSKIKSITQ
ncbi:MAG TPA: beta-N-acetylhexosaminidase [Bacillota bacterium]|nr:beta-N-acetylhexosaminidase [Bacillota bacterium]